MLDVRKIIDKCLRMKINPRIVNFKDVIEEDGACYKLLATQPKGISEDVFINSMDHGLFIDGVFDLGLEITDFSNVRCTLYRFTKDVPSELIVSRFNGVYEKTGCEIGEYGNDLKLHLDSLDAFIKGKEINNDVASYLRVSSPYGECIEVKDYSIDSGFEIPNEPLMATAKCMCRDSWMDSDMTPDEYRRMKNRSINKIPKRGDVWWVKNLEFGENGERNHGFKNHPIIVIGVRGGVVNYYMCTSNETVYYMPKYCLKNPREAGLKKDRVYFELREGQIEKERLWTFAGTLGEEDMKFVFDPPMYEYWKRQFKKVPCGN